MMPTSKPNLLVLLFSVFGLALAAGAGTQPARALRRGEVKTLDVSKDQLAVLHPRETGHAELPSMAISHAYAYVAFDVRTNGGTRVHLCRLTRGGGEADVREEVVSPDDAMSFGPSVAVEDENTVWLAWASFKDGMWTIRGRRVADMQASPVLEISGADGLNSQVKAAHRDGITRFVWVVWERGTYRIMANAYDGTLGQPRPIYEGPNPLGRPCIKMISGDHAIVAWDEYVDGRYAIRMREQTPEGLQPVREVSGETPANNYEPCLTAGRGAILAAWNRVPWGGSESRPAARLYPGALYEEGLDSPGHNEGWRVHCFSDDDDNTWIVWLNRVGHSTTRLYARRLGPDGLSEPCYIRFRRQERIFMNEIESAYDRNLVLAWENRGDIDMCEIELPRLGKGELASAEAEIAYPEDEAGSEAEDLEYTEGDDVGSPSAAAGPGRREPISYGTVYDGDTLRVYFGDYHNHTSFSDGRAFPDMSMLFARDSRRLDFICITDHDGPLMPSEFAWNNAVADMLTRAGRFVCLHGFEVSKDWAENGFGHWNMLFPGPVTIVRYEDGMTPLDLYRIAREYGAVVVPHHVAKKFAPHTWEYYDPVAEPVVEMCSLHGVFETRKGQEDDASMVEGRFVDDGLARGYKLGFVGASDFHNCFRSIFDEVGITGLYARSLTPEGVFEAIKHRRTFATTGCRVAVDFRCNGRFMGEELETSDDLSFQGYAESPDSIAAMEIISGGNTVFETGVLDRSGSIAWQTAAPDSEAYYYLRVRTAAGGLAWSSPIWISPAR
jgi:hypothetical protein